MIEGPPGSMMMVGKTIQTVERNVVVPMKDIAPIKYVKGSHIELGNRVVYIVGANDERAEEKIRGSTLAGAYLNEVTLFPRTVFEQVMARCSIAGAKVFGDTNPDSPYHWLRKDFFENPDLTESDLRRFRFKLEDNPILSDQYKDSLKRLYVGLWYRRMILGEWVAAAGAIYDIFDPNVHVVPFIPRVFDKIAVGIDYGTASVTTFIAAGRNNGKWWVFREYYYDARKTFRQKSNDEFADDFLLFLSGDGYADDVGPINPATVEIDPSASGLKVDLRKRGIMQLRNADNDVIEGIRTVYDALAAGDLYIQEACDNTQEEMSGYVWDEDAQEVGEDKPVKENDHTCDAIRYLLKRHYGRPDLRVVKRGA
jgi:PBSX family phage terminase large subunit